MIVKLKCPDYVQFDSFGNIEHIVCKLCGTTIAGMQDMEQGKELDKKTKTWIKTVVRQFRRFPNYAEVKIEFEDGSAHVTNLCDRCAQENIEPDILKAIYNADIDMEEKQGNKHTALLRKRVPSRVVTISLGGGII